VLVKEGESVQHDLTAAWQYPDLHDATVSFARSAGDAVAGDSKSRRSMQEVFCRVDVLCRRLGCFDVVEVEALTWSAATVHP
jgi:hypothetical protein